MKKILIIVLALAILVGGAWYIASMGDRDGDAVAVVNGEEIRRGELNRIESQIALQQGFEVSALSREERSQFRMMALDTIVSQTILRQAIERSGIVISEEAVDAQMQDIRMRFESEDEYNEALSFDGITEDELREEVTAELLAQAYLEQELDLSSIVITEAEIASAYEELAAWEENPPALAEVRGEIRNILVQQRQQELLGQLIEDLRAEADVVILI